MILTELIDSLYTNTLAISVPSFLPELILCGTIVLMLLLRVPAWGQKINVFWVALLGTGVALSVCAPLFFLGDVAKPDWVPEGAVKYNGDELFTGMLIYDNLTIFFRGVLLFFTFLFITLTRLTGIPDADEAPDFYTLVLGSVVGMCLMVSANHVLMVFLGVEMASVPAYVLAGTLKGRRVASEASLKFAIFGAGAAGIMLYGLSLLCGALGTAHIPSMATQMADMLAAGGSEKQLVLVLGGLMMAVGLAFKLSAVPFHFWAPDVFEGATAEIGAFLSVASKAAALGLLIRVAVGFGGASFITAPETPVAVVSPASVPQVHPVSFTALHPGEGEHEAETPAAPTSASRLSALAGAREYIVGLISLLAALTATWGNLAAYGQTNIKRLLAYSTIAHAGYMMMPIAAGVALLNNPAHGELAREAIRAVAVYVMVYLFMNLGAFAIVAMMRNAMRSEEISDYAGLIRTCPGVAICFALILVSLIGIPPLAGFLAKVYIFKAMVEAQLWWLLIIGGVNAVISLFYYLRVIKVMMMDPEPEQRLPIRFTTIWLESIYVVIVTLPLLAMTIWWESVERLTGNAVSNLF